MTSDPASPEGPGPTQSVALRERPDAGPPEVAGPVKRPRGGAHRRRRHRPGGPGRVGRSRSPAAVEPPSEGRPEVAGPVKRPRGGAHRRRRPRPSARRRAVEWLAIAGVALSVAVLMRVFVVQTFYIPSPSMTPTLNVGDRILVNKLAYRLHGVGRGDIVVFRRPPAEDCGSPVADLVKRVIGLPGETISDRNGTVYIDGRALAQPWLPKHDPDTFTPSFPPVKVGPNAYFVMGDDRRVSCDSRYWGTVSRSLIVGKVEMRIWPLGRLAFF